jgi:hypothetical protein
LVVEEFRFPTRPIVINGLPESPSSRSSLITKIPSMYDLGGSTLADEEADKRTIVDEMDGMDGVVLPYEDRLFVRSARLATLGAGRLDV